jgi:hypothetical protein
MSRGPRSFEARPAAFALHADRQALQRAQGEGGPLSSTRLPSGSEK